MKEDLASAARTTALAEFHDEGPYEVQCSKGHRSFVLLQEQRFEILFSIGTYAIVDGYYREAVSSFTASLERFYEYFIRAALIESGIATDLVDKAWRDVAAQSERQLGAFVFLCLRDTGEVPPILTPNEVKFRNQVIHRGKIPSRREAIDYGQRILTLLRKLRDLVKTHFPNAEQKLMVMHLSAARQQAGNDPCATATIPTTFSLVQREDKSLEESLNSLPRWSVT
jgi:hypothetical protein